MNYISFLAVFGILFASCDSFLSVAPPKTELTTDVVFHSDELANGAVLGIYGNMVFDLTRFAGGGSEGSITALAGLSAGELTFTRQGPPKEEFENHGISPDNTLNYNIWSSAYKAVFTANSVIAGLERSDGVTAAVKDQLLGECLFLRAFSLFYLVNCYGPVPVVTSDDYRQTMQAPRQAEEEVYRQIIDDLDAAAALLPESYTHAAGERIRVNRWTATALLARVHLYLGHWQEADQFASAVIDRHDLYTLEADIDAIYKPNNREAIWQLYPGGDEFIHTKEAYNLAYNVAASLPPPFAVSNQLLAVFEEGDKRRDKWIAGVTMANGQTTWYPYKYKHLSKAKADPKAEYSMVMRLAEQYLIRAEARIQLSETAAPAALADLNAVRERHAGLPPLAASGRAAVIAFIELERQREFFYEWGHRWFDLKRWGRADAYFRELQADWRPSALLYPIPQKELYANPFLAPQNAGY